ncbi:MAG: hypothetical protein Q9N26_03735 [Aquificota bacterium]|nr:hypothetical protein [Aquificota bacterium]
MSYSRGEVGSMIGRAVLTVLTLGVVFAKDPFLNQQDAVGYIILEREGRTERFIVVESKEGTVKLIKTRYEPEKVLKKGEKGK